VNYIQPGIADRKLNERSQDGGCQSCPATAQASEKVLGDDDPVVAWLKSFGPMQPFAVPIPDAQRILGSKARSQIYNAVGRGELDAVKDGSKTLIVVASIVRYCGRMQAAQIKPPVAKKTFRRPKLTANRPGTRDPKDPEKAA
jgi:hypothetical protein